MKNHKADRRSQRTRQALHNALIELMLEKHYGAITVQDIIDKANIGRSTFYAHYRDKEDLLTSQIEEMISQYQEATKETNGLLPTLMIFHHTQEHYRLYKALVWGQGIDVVFKAFEGYLNGYLEAALKEKLGHQVAAIPLPMIANFTTGAFLTLLKWWLDNNMPATPEQMDTYFRQLIIPSLESALSMRF
jgi:AcrR family transcriptional regulator